MVLEKISFPFQFVILFLKHTEGEVLNTQIFDTRDVIQLVKHFEVAQTVIVASERVKAYLSQCEK
jgi:hypothetical protein